MYLLADRYKHYCICPSFESPEPSAHERPPRYTGKQEEHNREDMVCGVDEWLFHGRCAIKRDQRKVCDQRLDVYKLRFKLACVMLQAQE
jgi:hypothetical protein